MAVSVQNQFTGKKVCFTLEKEDVVWLPMRQLSKVEVKWMRFKPHKKNSINALPEMFPVGQ